MPWMTWNLSLWGKAWSWRNLESRLYLLKQSCINIKAKWALFDSSFDIIKIMYTYIHILPLFDDDKHVISSRHHQSLHDLHSLPFSSKFFLTSSKSSWFTFSPFLMMTTTCRLGATTKQNKKNIYLHIIYSPLVLQWLLIWDN